MAGAPAPAPFVPPFNGPAPPAATLAADGVSATFAAPAPDPATLPTAFAATLVAANGTAVASQTLPPASTTVTFPGVQPGTYTVSLVAAYSEGASAPAVSAPVTLAAPKAKTKPRVVGPNVVGYRIACKNGAWAWPGAASFTVQWLRDGRPRPSHTSTTYKVGSADVGRKISCRVTLRATTGSVASATSSSSTAGVRLKLVQAPRVIGAARVGSTLRCTGGTWKHTGKLTSSLVWRRDGTIIKGATSARRTVEQADAGHQISCKVSVEVGPQSAWYRTASMLVR
jgi:hypothetical protein